MTAATENLVGIDLGTTFSAIATIDDRGQATTLPNREGEMLTPSVVLIDDNNVVVGQAAADVALEMPELTASMIKRHMGEKSIGRAVAGREIRPETLAALVLRKLVQDVEPRIGPVEKAVITVPAYFDDTRRKATKDAGRIAGLDVIDILDEPTAAALAYSFQQSHGAPSALADGVSKQETLLVYDLGGGTFDVTVVRLAPRRFEAVAIEGDVRLGGKDWDDRIAEFVAKKFLDEHGTDPRTHPQSQVALAAAAERAKKTLSKLSQANVTCTHSGQMLTVPLTRSDFEGFTKDLLTRTRLTTQEVLRRADMKWDDIDRILMVGGSTHMPMTGNMLRDISGKMPDNSLAVSEVVARGAALHAGIVSAKRAKAAKAILPQAVQSALQNIVEINVNSHSLGIEIKIDGERRNDILIPKNTQLPTAGSRVYKTVADNQVRVRAKVLQGEAPQADACISIGECWIEGLPANLPNRSPIQVRCGVGADGLVNVMALDMTSGKLATAEIHRSSGLSEEEIKQEAEWVKDVTVQ